MRRKLIVLAVLQILVLSAMAAEVNPECTLCIGLVADAQLVPAEPIPMLLRMSEEELTTRGAWLAALSPAQRRKVSVVVGISIDPSADPLLAVDQTTRRLVEWSRLHGPFDLFATSVATTDPAVAAYALKRLAVTAQGLEIASAIGIEAADVDSLKRYFDAEAHPYFDVVITPASQVELIGKWLSERDPSKKIHALVGPTSANAAFDAALSLAAGAHRAYLEAANQAPMATAIAQINSALRGDYAYDATSRATVLDSRGTPTAGRVLTFVRGEDLRSVLIPAGESATAFIVSLPSVDYTKPRRVGVAGERPITDAGAKGGRLLLGLQPTREPMALVVDRATRVERNVTRETIDIATRREITVEEIIRNHQAYKAYQESISPRYIARNTTKLRFAVGSGGDSVEATIAGDYFADPNGRADWVWRDFFINGVRWKYGRIPELPIVQPEKVTQLPLDLHLTNEYRYTLIGERDLLGYETYEVRFQPPAKASADLPLYRGTVWIDRRTWARVRIAMVQLHLTGEVLSNEESIDFRPFARGTNEVLTAAEVDQRNAREIVWLPSLVAAQQVVSAAGRSTAVERETRFEGFSINPPAFDDALKSALQSDARMVRETNAGLRYLEKRGNGERVVKEGYDTSRVFMLGGIHHDAGLEYPVVPLGGIDYFNFNLLKKGIQANVFFAGVILAANATHPNVGNTRTNVGVDFFALAVPTENSMYRDGTELTGQKVKVLPTTLTVRAGHPVFNFGKIDVSLTAAHLTYQRADETTAGFIVPDDTFVLAPSITAEYARKGYNVSAFYDYNLRTSWSPWGDLTEYSENQKSYMRYGGSIGKSFYLPKFQRIGIDVNYLSGSRLDRFAKYELGFFGAQRIHGIQSGSVRAEKAILAHFSYGFVISDQIRLEALYDHGLLSDRFAGLRREPFQGIGIAGQTVGPYGTLLRLDIGKTIGRNAQDGFVANVVFLKLF